MAYTQAEIAQAVSLLTQRIPGLTPTAANVWVTSEQGDNNNIVGVTDAHGVPYIYSTLAQGAQAAANLWSSKFYAPARAVVATTTDPAKQLQAIADSGWNIPYYHNLKSGFPQAIARLTGQPVPALTTAAKVTPTASGASGTTPPAATATSSWTVANLLSALPPAHPLAATDIEMILGELTVSGNNDPIIATQRAYYTKYIGQPINKVPVYAGSAFGGQLLGIDPNAIAAAAAKALFGDFAWVPGLAVNVGILALVLVLGYKGVTEILA